MAFPLSGPIRIDSDHLMIITNNMLRQARIPRSNIERLIWGVSPKPI